MYYRVNKYMYLSLDALGVRADLIPPEGTQMNQMNKL